MSDKKRTRGCPSRRCFSRREFLAAASAVSASALTGCLAVNNAIVRKVQAEGPASRCVPTVHAAFVRRKGDYGMSWPGAVYDGEAARRKYTSLVAAEAEALPIKLELRPEPIHSAQEADAWLQAAKEAKANGLLVLLLDRQQHAWPTAEKAIDAAIPTVVFSPVGSSFTTNTAKPSQKTGCFICSTDDFSQVRYGMKMLHAGAKLRATRCIVIKGTERRDVEMPHLGMKLRYVPAKTFLDEYQKTPATEEVLAIADDYTRRARRVAGASRDDVINGVKSYIVARTILEQEQGDAITMDCLGALGRTKVSLPCIAWSRMNDDGIPAACEADLGAAATHAIVQYLFDRPGFQQDPVAETARGAIIGAHCSCPTRLNGFSRPPEPFELCHHHGNRDAVPRTLWRRGQRVTSADVLPSAKQGQPAKMIISAGEVLENVSVPPAGGCVVSVMVRFDGVTDVLAYPGFHQVFFYGDYKDELVHFCRLFNIEPVVA
ncbi:MAG: hypothetical protein AB1696_02490 [Planctomycetota bacterium]